METANGKDDHVTTFILHLPLAVFSFSVKLSSFVLASKVSLFCSILSRTHFLKKALTRVSRLPFCRKRNFKLPNST